MATKNYTINFVDPTKSTITILPNTSAGPSGGVRYTDIDLIGMGNSLWGEKILENLLHILENFASDAMGSPFGPDTSFGSTPIQGQIWYNQTNGSIYVYDSTNWQRVGGITIDTTPPGNPSEGDLWWDTNGPVDQNLKIYIGTSWISVVGDFLLRDGSKPMTGDLDMNAGGSPLINKVTNLADPTDAQDAVSVNYADATYVNSAGDTMTGDLDMNAGSPLVNKVTNLGTPSDNSDDAVSVNYADATYVNVTGDTMTGDLNVVTNITTSNITATNNIVCENTLSIGLTGNSEIKFYDATNIEDRLLRWDDTNNEFRVDDDSSTTAPHTLIHSGNINNFSQPMTLIPSFNILTTSQGTGGGNYTLNYGLAGVPITANYVLLRVQITITNSGSTTYRNLYGRLSGNLILSGSTHSGGGGQFANQWWVPKSNTDYTVSNTAGTITVDVWVDGWM